MYEIFAIGRSATNNQSINLFLYFILLIIKTANLFHIIFNSSDTFYFLEESVFI